MSVVFYTEVINYPDWSHLGGTGDDDRLYPSGEYIWAYGYDGVDTAVFDARLNQVRLGASPFFEKEILVIHPDGFARLNGIELLELKDIRFHVEYGEIFEASDVTGGKASDLLISYVEDDVVLGRGGDDWLISGGGADRMLGGTGDDRIAAGSGDDLLRGGTGADQLFGEHGADRLIGGDGQDRLHGGRGSDKLDGGADRDVLKGGREDDILTGGAGADIFHFRRAADHDRITDFEIGADVIRFASGPEALDQLRFSVSGDDVLITFGRMTILVESVALDALRTDEHFVFL